jgi:hypothetical protein
MPRSPRPDRSRHGLSADVPELTESRLRRAAARYYRGAVGDAVTAALDTFGWLVEARQHGKRVIAVDPDQLPDAYEEPVIPGLPPASDDWTWLVKREHPWRRQLWIKGRNMTAGDFARTVEIAGWTPEEAARQYELPLDAVLEAQRYAETARALIDAEAAENRIAALTLEDGVAAAR